MANIIENMTKTIKMMQGFYKDSNEKWKISEMHPSASKNLMLVTVQIANGTRTTYTLDLDESKLFDNNNKLVYQATNN